MPATPPLRGDSGAPMRGGMRPGASMLCRPEFHTSGQVPSSGLHASAYPGSCGRSPRPPLFVAVACLVGLVVVAVLALDVPAGRERDAAMLHAFIALDRPSVGIARSGSWRISATRCPTRAPGCSASSWRSPADGGGARWPWRPCWWSPASRRRCSSTRWPSRAFSTGCPIDATNSWPSGHSTAAMTLALCAILVAPPVLRTAAAILGGAFAVGVGYALLVLGWHYPSDVLGGLPRGRPVDVAGRRRAAPRRGARARAPAGVGADRRPRRRLRGGRRGGAGRAHAHRRALHLRAPDLRRRRADHPAARPRAGGDGQRRVNARRTPSPIRTAPVARSSAPIAPGARAGSR